MNEAAGILESFLEIYLGWTHKLDADESEIKDYGITKWNRDLLRHNIPDEENMFSQGYSFMILFKLSEEGEDMGDKIAKSHILITDNKGNPEVGLVIINPNKNYKTISPEYLTIIMLHQFTHLLAFKEEILLNELCFTFVDLVEGRYYLRSNKVLEYAVKYFGCSISDIEIIKDEEGNFHWPARYFLGEYMSDITYSEELVISEFTLALFEDLGYLKVKNKYTGGLMRFGKHQGYHQFLVQQCINNEKQFKNDFYYPTDEQIDRDFVEPSCSSGRLSKTIHKLIYHESIPESYQYYDTSLGGLKSAEYCPVSMPSSDIIYSNYCFQEKNTPNINVGESFSSHSFCALSSLVSTDVNDYLTLSQSVRAVCFEMYCSEKSLSIKYGDYYFVCPREGGKIAANEIGFAGYLLCPDYNLICTGTKLCNNIFDCIKEKSTEKDNSFNYEEYESQYETAIIKTTQISSEYINADNSDGWEEDEENGKCPLTCAVCKKKTINKENNYQCIKCRNGFGLKG